MGKENGGPRAEETKHEDTSRMVRRAKTAVAVGREMKVNKPDMTMRPAWEIPADSEALPPPDMTVTHVNQSYKLWKSKGSVGGKADQQNSEEWLEKHNVDNLNLTLKDLVDVGTVGKPIADKDTGKVRQHIQFESTAINEFEYKLNLCIQKYTERMKWLLTGSKRAFGLTKSGSVAVLVDTSDVNAGYGRLMPFKEALMHLVDEQLSTKEKLYMVSFGTDTDAPWEVPRDVNIRIVDEAKMWINNLAPSGGCNLLKAVKKVLKFDDIDYIMVVLGSMPDQKPMLLCDYLHQRLLAHHKPFHCVAYDCNNSKANAFMQNLSELTGGRYHCYTSTSEEQIYSGDDIKVILKEVERCQDILNKIKDMRRGIMGTALVSIMDEISAEVEKLPQSRFLPRPPGHHLPLRLDDASVFNPKSSNAWLRDNGLKGKSLDLYQVLAPNAHVKKEEFVSVLRKTITSQVNKAALTPFEWEDGSIKNVHVDFAKLFEYQKHLGGAVKLYEDRVTWLSNGSRKIFGTVVENNVVIIVDLSVSNVNYLVHIQHSLRLLLEQQLSSKNYINIVTFGTKVLKWRPTLTKVTPESLQQAWLFCLDMQCGGSRNFIGAFREAMENDEEAHHSINVEGVYLFGSGVPDQKQEHCVSYVEQCTAGRGASFHTVLFNVDDYDENGAIPSRWSNITTTADTYRSLAHVTGGRFHWFRESGIIESDDIRSVTSEIEKAVNFSRRCSDLVSSVKNKYKDKPKSAGSRYHLHCTTPASALTQPAAEDKQFSLCLPTAHGAAPLQLTEGSSQSGVSSSSSSQRPMSVVTGIPRGGGTSTVARSTIPTDRSTRGTVSVLRSGSSQQATPAPSSVHTATGPGRDPMQKVKPSMKKTPSVQSFYTDNKNAVGQVYKNYPKQKSVKKDIRRAVIPEEEAALSTRDWLKMYSLSKLRLDLDRLVSGPDCKHMEQNVKSIKADVGARYCHIFPSINVKGTIKHLQLMPHELLEYDKQAKYCLERYTQRLKWLLSGSRRVFGTVTHPKCVILVDVSGSMQPHMNELRKELASLVWDQLYPLRAKFNMMSFSNDVKKWQSQMVDSTEGACHDCIQWISKLEADGNTCTMESLQAAFTDIEADSVYMLSDGKPDRSTAYILKQVAEMNKHRRVIVNTVSFRCEDNSANEFLKMLAAETGGRYHRCHDSLDVDMFAHEVDKRGPNDQTLRIPVFDGDDLRRLASEIALCRQYLSQSKSFREQYNTKKSGTDEKPAGGKTRISSARGSRGGTASRATSVAAE